MPSESPWTITPTNLHQNRSIFGSIRKLGRKNSSISNGSIRSITLDPESPSTSTLRGPPELNALSQSIGLLQMQVRERSPFVNPSPATRRPNRPGMNAFTVPSNEPPPAYTPSPARPSQPNMASYSVELPSPSYTTPAIAPATTSITATASAEDPYAFLETFDTTLLIDDSGSMAGRSWREVSQALSTLAPIVTQHDSDGIDIYFLNHKSTNPGDPNDGIAAGGYRSIKRAETVTEIFQRVRPGGGTPTGIRVHNILRPYLEKLERQIALGREVKPLNLIVLTDGVPSDDVESVLLSAAKKLDKLDAPPYQVGVQFFQVGNEPGAKEALMELDDGLSALVEGGARDIVDTVTWTAGNCISEGGIGLTSDAILKVVLGAVVKRLDRRRASGEIRRA